MSTSDSSSSAVDTIVLIHGLWLTARSWEEWVPYYSAKGYNVLTPTYPGFEVEVEALREDPSIIASQTITSIVEHLDAYVKGLDRPVYLMGHSFGGTLVQLLLDRGYGAAGVAINSAPTEGVLTVPPSQAISVFPVLKNPANRHKAVGFTREEFHYAFTNSLEPEEAAAAYDRYQIAAPGGIVWDGILANFTPGQQAAAVNYHNDDRAPLLFIAGGTDHIMPPAVNKSNANHYKSPDTITEYYEFPGRCHFTAGQKGWEEVADYALSWVEKVTKPAA